MANKVWIITSENFPFGGAAANFLRLLAIGLSNNGLSVEVYILKGFKYGQEINLDKCGIYDRILYKYISFKNRSGIKILKIIDDILGIFKSLILIIRFRFLKGQNSIFIFIDKGFRGLLPILFLRILRIKSIGIIVEGYDNLNSNFFQKLDNLLKFRFNNRLFSGIFVLSFYLKNLYKDVYTANQIFLQPNLLEIEKFNLPNRKSAYINSGIIRLGYSGVPTQQKDGIADLLYAISILVKENPELELLIIGDSLGDSMIPDLEKLSNSLGIRNNVIFTGLRPQHEISELLHSCDILVLTRPDNLITKAGFPTKLGEYLACKKPVILTSFGDIPHYFKDGYNAVLANPGDPNSIAEKTKQLLSDKNNWEVIAENGYKWAKDNLDYLISTKRLINFFNL